MKKGLLFWVFVIASLTSAAQVSKDTPEGIIDNFFNVYEKDGVKAAVDNIYSYGDTSMQQSLFYVRDTLFHTANYYGGKYLGYELINKKSVSQSLCVYTCLVKYRLAPLRFTFTFYKPADKWKIMNFLFDGAIISEMIKESKVETRN